MILKMNKINHNRRQLIKNGVILCGATAMPSLMLSCTKTYQVEGLSSVPDSNGLLLPPNCSSRIVARSGSSVENTDYTWHAAPDGGGVVPFNDGGWIYVSNSELNHNKGGAGVIRFNREGEITTAYSILQGTSRNCGGCMTPWNTWLSCEEVGRGVIWECDPFGDKKAIARPSLGVFSHEAVAIDPDIFVLYITEDEKDSCFYRYLPANVENGKPDLEHGILEAAVIDAAGDVEWREIVDPSAKSTATRKQVKDATHFNGGEGIVHNKGKIYFDTKGDDRIWMYDITAQKMSVFYDAATFDKPVLTGVDAITMYDDTLLVCEDGGDLQIVAITQKNEIKPILQLVGHDDSEVTGAALSPDKSRLYFSSQKGSTGKLREGITFEVTGTFL
jgi:uncharacterized protein